MIGPQGQSLVFLLGVPRSGTTLLSHLLDQHPQIASPAEPWLMLAVDSIGEVHPLHAANGAVLGQAYENFTGELNVPRAKRAFARELYNQALERNKKKIFVDKTPRYYQLTDHLVEIFPSSKFLHLKRNPFAVAASLKATWNFDLVAAIEEKQSPFLFDLVLGFRYLERFSEDHHRLVHTCSYEALVQHTHNVMKDALLFLGCRAGPVPKKIRRLDVHNKAMGDKNILNTKSIHKNGLSSWERILSREEKQIVHDIFSAEGLAAIGYGDLLPKLLEAGIEDRGVQRADELFTEIQGRYRSQRQFVQSTARTQVGSDLRIAAARIAFAKPDSVLKLGSIERDLEEARAQLARRTEEISLLSQNKDELTEAVARQTSEIERMGSLVATLKTNLTELERQHDAHGDIRSQLEAELSTARERMAQLANERDGLNQAVTRQTSEVERMGSLVATLKTNLTELERQHDAHGDIRSRLETELNTARERMAQLANERHNLSEALARQDSEVGRLESVVAALKNNLTALERQNEVHRVEAVSLREERDRLGTELSTVLQRLAQQTDEISLISRERDELTETVARQTSEVGRLDSVVNGLRKSLSEIEQQKEVHRTEAVSFREERDRLGTELSSVRHRLAHQADETSLISRERDELTETVARQASEVGRLDSVMNGLRKSLGEIEQQKEVHRTEADSLRAERDRLGIELSTTRQRLTETAKRDEEPNIVVQGMTQLVNERDQLNETVSRQAREIQRLDLIIAKLRRNVTEVEQHKDIEAEREKPVAPVSHDTNLALPLHASIDQLARLERAIADIKRSPFWRLRNRTDRLLRTFHIRRRQMAEWERSDSRLYALNDQIGHLERAIADMKRSPFWTLRNRVDRLLRVLHLRHRQMAEWERSDSKR